MECSRFYSSPPPLAVSHVRPAAGRTLPFPSPATTAATLSSLLDSRGGRPSQYGYAPLRPPFLLPRAQTEIVGEPHKPKLDLVAVAFSPQLDPRGPQLMGVEASSPAPGALLLTPPRPTTLLPDATTVAARSAHPTGYESLKRGHALVFLLLSTKEMLDVYQYYIEIRDAMETDWSSGSPGSWIRQKSREMKARNSASAGDLRTTKGRRKACSSSSLGSM